MKLRCSIFMNCHGCEIQQYLNCCPEFCEKYTIDFISTYQNLDNSDNIITQFKDSDLIITNNIKKYEKLTPQYLKTITSARIIIIEFFRFSGFILPQSVYDLNIWNIPKNISYNEYYNMNLDKNDIIKNFNNSLEKLKKMDMDSDIKFYDFFRKL